MKPGGSDPRTLVPLASTFRGPEENSLPEPLEAEPDRLFADGCFVSASYLFLFVDGCFVSASNLVLLLPPAAQLPPLWLPAAGEVAELCAEETLGDVEP